MKTYAAKGMLECNFILTTKYGARIRVSFTGGSMGTNGIIPAKFSTDNPLICEIIESCTEYCADLRSDKRIYLYSNDEDDESKNQPNNRDGGYKPGGGY